MCWRGLSHLVLIAVVIRCSMRNAFVTTTSDTSYPMIGCCYFLFYFFLLSCTAQCIHLCCSRSNWLKDCKVIAFYLHADYFSLDLRYITRISDANDCIPQWNRSTPAIVHCESIASNAMQCNATQNKNTSENVLCIPTYYCFFVAASCTTHLHITNTLDNNNQLMNFARCRLCVHRTTMTHSKCGFLHFLWYRYLCQWVWFLLILKRTTKRKTGSQQSEKWFVLRCVVFCLRRVRFRRNAAMLLSMLSMR